MHYYQFHIGDYRAATSHLSNEEDLAYRRLLDMYYDTEAPIPTDIDWVSRRLRLGSEVVLSVLKDMFELTENGYVNRRADSEIKAYHAYKLKQQTNGKRGGRPKKTQAKPTANPEETQQEPKKSLTTNHKPTTKNQEIKPPIPPKGGNPAISLATYLENCKQEGRKPIPENSIVFDYAKKVGLPNDFLKLQWLEFKARYSLPNSKRYRRWDTVFYKSVQGNWFKLWFAEKDEYVLTTVGQQAKKANREAA